MADEVCAVDWNDVGNFLSQRKPHEGSTEFIVVDAAWGGTRVVRDRHRGGRSAEGARGAQKGHGREGGDVSARLRSAGAMADSKRASRRECRLRMGSGGGAREVPSGRLSAGRGNERSTWPNGQARSSRKGAAMERQTMINFNRNTISSMTPGRGGLRAVRGVPEGSTRARRGARVPVGGTRARRIQRSGCAGAGRGREDGCAGAGGGTRAQKGCAGAGRGLVSAGAAVKGRR